MGNSSRFRTEKKSPDRDLWRGGRDSNPQRIRAKLFHFNRLARSQFVETGTWLVPCVGIIPFAVDLG